MDGWVVIRTSLETKQLEKDLKNAEKQLDKFSREEEQLLNKKQKLELDTSKAEREMDNLDSKIQMVKKSLESAQEKMSGFADWEVKMKTPSYEKSVESVNKLQSQYDSLVLKADNLNDKYQKQTSELSKINAKIKENATNQDLMKKKISETSGKMKGLNVDTQKIGQSLGNTIKKVGKWAIAVFGVRTAYSAIRNAMSTLSQYNDELANKLNSIKLIFASALEPVVTRLVNLIYQLLTYVNYLSKAWFNVDLFAKASALSAKSSASALKDAKKYLTGFDEMNVAQDTSTSTSGGTSGGTGFIAPTEAKIPSWIEWISNNGGNIISIIGGITGALVTLKVLGLDPIKSLGIGVMIAGIIKLIIDLKEYLPKLNSELENNGTTWEEFGTILTDIGIIILGLGIVTGNWIVILIGAIATISGVVLKNWEKIKGCLTVAYNWINTKFLLPLEKKFGIFGESITNPFRLAISIGKNLMEGLFKTVKGILDGILLFCKGDFKGGLISIGKGILNGIITILNYLIGQINAIVSPIRFLITGIAKVIGKDVKMSDIKIPTIKYLKTGGIINMPGRGIPVGGAVGGESGREGVIPLTDSQAMEKLGEAIGKYITINANITNTMNGRVLSRELQKIQNSNNFAINR